MVDTDTFCFDSSAMFTAIRKVLQPASVNAIDKRTENLIDSKDDMIFVWNPMDCCVLALNWRMAKAKEAGTINYQVCDLPFDFL